MQVIPGGGAAEHGTTAAGGQLPGESEPEVSATIGSVGSAPRAPVDGSQVWWPARSAGTPKHCMESDIATSLTPEPAGARVAVASIALLPSGVPSWPVSSRR